MRVPFVDLPARFAQDKQGLHDTLSRVLDHGQMVLGVEVERFEQRLSEYVSSNHAIGVGNATDGLMLGMQALNIGPGDEVITTPMSYLASTSSIVLAGATPVYADVSNDLNLSAQTIEKAITSKTKAILVVHLAGNPANMPEIMGVANKHGLKVIEDCAQAFGSAIGSQKVGTFGDVGVYSFHPLKTLCTLGDGGAIVSKDASLAAWLAQARNHGHQGRDDCDFWSINSRMDALHAGFLQVMLDGYDDFIAQRQSQVARYQENLGGLVSYPTQVDKAFHVHGMFVTLVDRRDDLQQFLQTKGVETKIHYPNLIPQLKAAKDLNHNLFIDNAMALSKRILSLPVGEHISFEQIDYVCEKIREFYQG